jgi:peptide/nickel transport system substrate-binding protein
MENFYSRIRDSKILGKLPSRKEMSLIFSSFSRKGKIFFVSLVIVLTGSTLVLLQSINTSFMVKVPQRGGSVSEGIVGAPRFVNPLLASTPADLDLVALIYSGLMRKSADGSLMPDLAEKYEVSEDGLVYTFILKDGLSFHNGKPISADDVSFTIEKAKDSVIKSPQKVNWDGVGVEILDEKTIVLTLRQPYASFLEDTTLGIMPKHIWGDSPIELNEANTNPVGSGPYMISEVNKQTSGIIDSYELIPFREFALGEPYIKKLSLHFYSNEDDLISALRNKTVSQTNSITPENGEVLLEQGYQVESSTLPRVFGLFFNQSVNQLFVNKVVVEAIDQAIDKEKIVRNVLSGYGVSIDSPIPPNKEKYQKKEERDRLSREETIENVKESLSKDGWDAGEDGTLEKTTKEGTKKVTTKLEFSISTGNTPDLVEAAKIIQESLAMVGMKVDVKTFEIGNLNQSVIRPRQYDALLFGQIINDESDLFAFWHSSQRKDPGLNIALYTNVKVDKILEEAFVTLDAEERVAKYIEFQEEIAKDKPAVFLYSPSFVYVVSKDLKQETPTKNIISPSDRYLNIYSWYTKTEKVWRVFAD